MLKKNDDSADAFFSEKNISLNNCKEVDSMPIRHFFITDKAKAGTCWAPSVSSFPPYTPSYIRQIASGLKNNRSSKKQYFIKYDTLISGILFSTSLSYVSKAVLVTNILVRNIFYQYLFSFSLNFQSITKYYGNLKKRI